MDRGKQTLYDVLDLSRDSDTTAIALAHKRIRAEMERETSAPDARRAALVHEAYEVLSDPQRRAAYDKSLGAPSFLGMPASARARPKWAGAFAGLAVVVAALYFTLHRPASPPAPGARSPEDILANASFSVGLLQRIDMSGKSVPVGLAVAIDEGVMVTTCHGLAPGAQLVVRLVGRSAPARVTMADEELDLCRLAVEGAGSRPIAVAGDGARRGDAVYAVSFTTDGQVARRGTIQALLPTPKGDVLETSIAVDAASSGGPIVDTAGRLVGIMTAPHAYGEGRNVALPAKWLNDPRWIAGAR
jgi:S1-C subfamily serine protease